MLETVGYIAVIFIEFHFIFTSDILQQLF